MSKTTYKISNWSDYNQALRERGSLSFWVSEEFIEHWEYEGPNQQGARQDYSDMAIEACLKLRLLFSLPFRQTQGFVASLFEMLQISLPVPDYSTLSRRAEDLSVDLQTSSSGEDIHIIMDSTGLKVYGESEWKQRTHGKQKKRTWRKLHMAIDSETGQITAARLTDNSVDDASQADSLLGETLRQPIESIARALGDGGYDRWKCYEAIEDAGVEPIIPPQKNAKIKKHGNAKGPPLPRDETIRCIRAHGRSKWKRMSGYHQRSLIEATMRRFKTIIGPKLRARKFAGQVTEACLGSKILNQMAQLGMPDSYKVDVV
jgi:IS5 family transposase